MSRIQYEELKDLFKPDVLQHRDREQESNMKNWKNVRYITRYVKERYVESNMKNWKPLRESSILSTAGG